MSMHYYSYIDIEKIAFLKKGSLVHLISGDLSKRPSMKLLFLNGTYKNATVFDIFSRSLREFSLEYASESRFMNICINDFKTNRSEYYLFYSDKDLEEIRDNSPRYFSSLAFHKLIIIV